MPPVAFLSNAAGVSLCPGGSSSQNAWVQLWSQSWGSSQGLAAVLLGKGCFAKSAFPGVAFNTGALLENPSVLAGLPGTLIFAGISLSVNSRLKAY